MESNAAELERLAKLHESGALTDSEYSEAKQKLLAKIDNDPSEDAANDEEAERLRKKKRARRILIAIILSVCVAIILILSVVLATVLK